MVWAVTLLWRDVFFVQFHDSVFPQPVTSSCNDVYEVTARDANYTLRFQTQGQGDIQTTGTFYTGIFITSSKTCKRNEGVSRGGGVTGKYRALRWRGVRSEGGFTFTVGRNKRERLFFQHREG